MYTYIVNRTQIYLSREQAAALDREARRRGTTRSHLIREAIDQAYVAGSTKEEVLAALDATAGAWTGREEDGATYVSRLRDGRRWAELYPDETSRGQESESGG